MCVERWYCTLRLQCKWPRHYLRVRIDERNFNIHFRWANKWSRKSSLQTRKCIHDSIIAINRPNVVSKLSVVSRSLWAYTFSSPHTRRVPTLRWGVGGPTWTPCTMPCSLMPQRWWMPWLNRHPPSSWERAQSLAMETAYTSQLPTSHWSPPKYLWVVFFLFL